MSQQVAVGAECRGLDQGWAHAQMGVFVRFLALTSVWLLMAAPALAQTTRVSTLDSVGATWAATRR